MIFSSNRNGTDDLFKQRLDSDVAEPFVVAPGSQSLARVTSDGQWILYLDVQPEKPARIMRVPLVGGRPEPLVTYPSGAGGWCLCAFHGRCVLLEYSSTSGSPVKVFALDPIRGKQQQLTQFPSGAPGAALTPDGEHVAYVVPDETIHNRIRILSFHGEPSQDIVVKNAGHLGALDLFPTGGFLSQDIASPHQPLLFITAEGNAHVLWRPPEQLDVAWAIPSADDKHLAITAATGQSNVWLVDQS